MWRGSKLWPTRVPRTPSTRCPWLCLGRRNTLVSPRCLGSGKCLLYEERRAPSATTAERKLNTLSFRELCGGSPGNGRLGAPTSLKTRQQPKKPRALSEINWYIATIKPSPTRLITTSTTTMQALMRGRAGSTRRGSKMAYVCRKKKPPYSNCETSRSTSGARKIATRRLLVRIETSWTSARR